MKVRRIILALAVVLVGLPIGCGRSRAPAPTAFSESTPGLAYTNDRVASVPWSIHIVRVDRLNPALSVHSLSAKPDALGLSPLSKQLRHLSIGLGQPVAGVNGDFYQRDDDFAGDPRGLQILEGELRSAPNGGACFWIDRDGQPHATNVDSRFHVTWPDGSQTPFGLNSERPPNGLVLYTRTAGTSTHSRGGREWVLEVNGSSDVPLTVNDSIETRVQEVRSSGNAALRPGLLILSAGPALAKRLPPVNAGDRIRLSTGTIPELRGAQTAIGGGPVLVRNGHPVQIPTSSESYEYSSMLERHPRTAVGWNANYLFLVTVDGRQPGLSVGMTLEELGQYLADLGCTDATNLDGGGSATLWCEGRVRNSPCDGEERPIANALVVVRRQDVPSGKPTVPNSTVR